MLLSLSLSFVWWDTNQYALVTMETGEASACKSRALRGARREIKKRKLEKISLSFLVTSYKCLKKQYEILLLTII